jgi:hypothetical protein
VGWGICEKTSSATRKKATAGMNALEECWIVLIAPNHQLGHRAQDLDNEVLVSIVNDLVLAQLRVEIPGSGRATMRGQKERAKWQERGQKFFPSKYNARRCATHLRLSSENCSFGLPAHQAAHEDMTAVNLAG